MDPLINAFAEVCRLALFVKSRGQKSAALECLDAANDMANSMQQPFRGRAYELLDAIDAVVHGRA